MKEHQKLRLNKFAIVAIVLSSVIIQAIIITYNKFTGYISVNDILNWLFRLSFGSFVSIIISIIAFKINTEIIYFLDKRLDWNTGFFKRIIIEFILAIISAIILISSITLILNEFGLYQGVITRHLINNALIFSVINIIYFSVLEGVLFYQRWQKEQLESESLKKENALALYEALKNQVNPHFLFNSLNILASIVRKDQEKAERFIEKFSMIYRYILDTSNKIVVRVDEEINFLKAYLDLMKYRHNEGMSYEIEISSDSYNKYIIPMGLQILVENAFKHNNVSKKEPLNIRIFVENNMLIVENNINKIEKTENREGKGLENLKNRISLISDIKPSFMVKNDYFIAKIPLIEAE